MVIPRILCFRTANLCFCTENTCFCTENICLCTGNINFHPPKIQINIVSLTLYFENTTSPIGIFFVALGFICGLLCGWVGWKKHQQTMQEIESNLRELKEY